jgi:PleD family two-component response regulator
MSVDVIMEEKPIEQEPCIPRLMENTIIMVDDNTDEIFMTRRQMRKEGIINRFLSEKKPENLTKTLEQLYEMGTNPRSIIILLDINMPKLNGFELVEQLKQHDKHKHVNIIMLSGSQEMSDMFHAYDLGADSYLVKPLQGEEFFCRYPVPPRYQTPSGAKIKLNLYSHLTLKTSHPRSNHSCPCIIHKIHGLFLNNV